MDNEAIRKAFMINDKLVPADVNTGAHAVLASQLRLLASILNTTVRN
jgi:hypothetical protein